MPFEPNLNNPQRYSRTFNVLDPSVVNTPFFFMAANTTGVAGDVLRYSTEDTVAISTSGDLRHQTAGFLLQDVKDLDAGAVKGYRNLNNTVEHLGGNVGVLQKNTTAQTKRYIGSPAVGDRLITDGNNTGKLQVYNVLSAGDPLAVVESIVSSAIGASGIEPVQKNPSNVLSEDFIRIRIYNL